MRAPVTRDTRPQAGVMAQQRLQALGVMLGRVDAAAVRHADDDGAGEAAARAVALAGHVVRDLVQGGVDEAHELDFGDDFQALRGHADGHAGDHAFGERRVLHAVAAEALLQAGGGAEHAAVGADVLADQDDVRIARHLGGQRHVDGLDQCDLGHGLQLPAGCAA